ncbi:hypothetical protein [Halobaculum litoreum]|uniref:Uncharacterized protein n=1 Tax=Halobaculum litoreum TaxID=3031998 RepID=A0ABD5XTN4_9EURY|nr:hypothetical protein [Halobaculum sp. DT92]
MRPRYELLQGVLLLGLSAAIVGLFGVPASPVLATVLALFAVGGAFAFVAGLRVEGRVAGRDVDHVTLRGVAGCALGVGMCVLGTGQMRAGDLFGLAVVLAGVFVLGVGVATIQRRPSVMTDDEL